MEMTDLIGPGGVVTNLRVTSKKQALQEMAERSAELSAQPEWAILVTHSQTRTFAEKADLPPRSVPIVNLVHYGCLACSASSVRKTSEPELH